MTRSTAHTVANVLLGAAAAATGFYVLRNPRLRRAALRALSIGMKTTIPGYLLRETLEAWRETEQRAA